MLIESYKNIKVKNLLLLESKKKERKNQDSFVVEGLQENYWALKANFIVKEFFICEEIFKNKIDLPNGIIKNYVSKMVFEKIAYRKTTGGLIGLYKTRLLNLEDIKLTKNPLIVVVDAMEKPGNLGAVLRNAEACGADAVILSDSLLDVYNSNVVRSSVGTIFLNQVVVESSIKIQEWLKANQIIAYATYLDSHSESIYKFNFNQPTAFVFGTESTGLAKNWLDFCNHKVIIPMLGKIDSLNVSNATAICLFEATRQRNFAK